VLSSQTSPRDDNGKAAGRLPGTPPWHRNDRNWKRLLPGCFRCGGSLRTGTLQLSVIQTNSQIVLRQPLSETDDQEARA